ncbi:uncharacterized protein V1516DRAFT_144518 [Lipomyces oligophaga]|uniref:uncharacterized protein n=1 Tax=Lipomyces oligophaga TaxID=45792 RepID=UPI0034CED637
MSDNWTNRGQGDFDLDGTPRPGYIARMYWVVMGATLGFTFFLRACDYLLYLQRIRSGSAKPRLFISKAYSSLTSIGRITTYVTPTFLQRYSAWVAFPSLGRGCIALVYFLMLIGFFFYKLNRSNIFVFEDVAYRASWLTIAQLPLVTLLSCRRLPILTFITGAESAIALNYFHRMAARGLFMTSCLHFFYQIKYYEKVDLLQYQLETDPITKNGIRTFSLLAWLVVVSSIRPIRHYVFSFFYANHVAFIIAFLIMAMRHIPTYAHVYLWISIGIICADVGARWALIIINNFSLPAGLKYQAHITTMIGPDEQNGNRTLRITIPLNGNPRLMKWSPGQFVYLMFPTYAPFISLPFSIISVIEDNELEFIVQVKAGVTRWLYKFASKSPLDPESKGLSFERPGSELLEKQSSLVDSETGTPAANPFEISSRPSSHRTGGITIPVIIDGPYGGSPRSFKQFATVLALASGVGATYTLGLTRGLLVDIAKMKSKKGENTSPLHTIEVAWIVRSLGDVFEAGFKTSLDSLLRSAEICPEIKTRIRIYVSDSNTLPDNEDSYPFKHNSNIQFLVGKPSIRQLVLEAMRESDNFGELGIAVCGSRTLTSQVKNSASLLMDARASNTGSGLQSCYVHVEKYQS